jgi:flagellar hook-associated protein 3 FlgL
MVMRLTENLKFSTSTDNIFLSQSKYAELMEQISTQKRINKPSDDPVGTRAVLDYRKTQASVVQYRRNVDVSQGWLNMSETKLSNIRDLLVQMRETAITQATATATAETRATAAETVELLTQEVYNLANAQYNGRYLFAGSKTETEPFSTTARTATLVETAESASGNTFDGTAISGGTYTGTSNRTYVVKVTAGGAPGTAVCDISADGGRTWSTTGQTIPAGGTIALGDGVTMTFVDSGSNDLDADDIFYVDALAAGYFNGDGEDISVNVGEGVSFAYNLSGEDIFTTGGSGTTDIFSTLHGLKAALQNNDLAGIQSALDGLESASNSVNLHVSKAGSKQNRLEVTDSNLQDLDYQVTQLRSDTEDADLARVITEFSQRETALQAAYQIAATIGNISIMNFMR